MKSPNPATPRTLQTQDNPPALGAVKQRPRAARNTEQAPTKSGFDPYNSGVFDRRGAWEKVLRK